MKVKLPNLFKLQTSKLHKPQTSSTSQHIRHQHLIRPCLPYLLPPSAIVQCLSVYIDGIPIERRLIEYAVLPLNLIGQSASGIAPSLCKPLQINGGIHMLKNINLAIFHPMLPDVGFADRRACNSWDKLLTGVRWVNRKFLHDFWGHTRRGQCFPVYKYPVKLHIRNRVKKLRSV